MSIKYLCDMCHKEVEVWVLLQYSACASHTYISTSSIANEVKSDKMLCKTCAEKINRFIHKGDL